ncbi:MAG: peptide-methionine (S)-S-oxide reductase MsrA [Candidatus Sungiibacteriota bacterium]
MTQSKKEIAVFGGGCFWCTEAVFRELRGVSSVLPGYAGGHPPAGGENPTYEQVCGGTTGHAEVIKIDFDPAQIKYEDLLTVFFATHDSTTLNRQGNDVGTQYRSIILYTTEDQQKKAIEFIASLNVSVQEGSSVITEIKPLDKFYEAENEHRDYYAANKNQPYCQLIIQPKLEKVQQKFSALLKMHGAS